MKDRQPAAVPEYNPAPMQLAIDGIPIIIYIDRQGLTHMQRDYRVTGPIHEADLENPQMGHEARGPLALDYTVFEQ